MADSEAVRAKRSRRHRNGDHSLCRENRCVALSTSTAGSSRTPVPCAGCDKPVAGGQGSLPTGQRMCQPCRRTNPQHLAKKKAEAMARARATYLARKVEKACAQCGVTFVASGPEVRCCSYSCGQRLRWDEGRTPWGERRTPESKAALRLERWQRKNRRRRALKKSAASEPYTTEEIAERDKSRCGICGDQVDMTLRRPHLLAPTIDHVLPIVAGGSDLKANVQLAHFICNSRKGAKVA